MMTQTRHEVTLQRGRAPTTAEIFAAAEWLTGLPVSALGDDWSYIRDMAEDLIWRLRRLHHGLTMAVAVPAGPPRGVVYRDVVGTGRLVIELDDRPLGAT
ncbi:MAG: hypothetical protein C0497_05960 [Gemmatimonas sp.]|nr:hypothetical protein [Gemmatimonas sp.]